MPVLNNNKRKLSSRTPSNVKCVRVGSVHQQARNTQSSKGDSVKHVVLCALLITFFGVVTAAQEGSSEKKQDQGPVSTPLTSIGPKSHWSFQPALNRRPTPFITFLETSPSPTQLTGQPAADQSFHWLSAIKQSLLFLGVQHGYAMTQPKTRRDLKGPFFKDYVRSVKSLHGWEDGGRFFTNYIAHPMEGSLLGFIQIQNDPKGMKLRYDNSNAYWRSRLKALAWAAAWSTQFEIGPVSQASIGNVGLHGKQTYVDLVVTPIAGVGWLVMEDFVDKNVISLIERRNPGRFYVKVASRTFLNPTRSIANLLRFKAPWYRNSGLR